MVANDWQTGKETLPCAILDNQSDSSFHPEKMNEGLGWDKNTPTLSPSLLSTQEILCQEILPSYLELKWLTFGSIFVQWTTTSCLSATVILSANRLWRPRTLAPTKVIPLQGQVLWAQRKALGWSSVGAIDQDINYDWIGASHQVLQNVHWRTFADEHEHKNGQEVADFNQYDF